MKILFYLFLLTSTLCANIIDDLQEHLPKILIQLLSNLADIIVKLKSITFDQLGNFKNFGNLVVGGIVDFPFVQILRSC